MPSTTLNVPGPGIHKKEKRGHASERINVSGRGHKLQAPSSHFSAEHVACGDNCVVIQCVRPVEVFGGWGGNPVGLCWWWTPSLKDVTIPNVRHPEKRHLKSERYLEN